jgi:DNA polymerase-3 subunit epsilon
VKQAVPSPPAFLQRIASKGAYDTEAGSPAVLTYLTLLDRVLEDRVIDTNEQETLVSSIEQLGLSREQVVAAHTTYLQHLTAQALADGVVTDAEQADLQSVADLLGTDRARLYSLLDQTRAQLGHLVASPPSAADLAGLSVCFTGELQSSIRGAPVTRAVAQRLAEKVGLVIANNVTKKLDVLVVADPNSQSGKAKKARSYGTRIVTERVFWQMIGVAAD